MCVVDRANDVYVILYPSPLTERNVARREVDFAKPRCKINQRSCEIVVDSREKSQEAVLFPSLYNQPVVFLDSVDSVLVAGSFM